MKTNLKFCAAGLMFGLVEFQSRFWKSEGREVTLIFFEIFYLVRVWLGCISIFNFVLRSSSIFFEFVFGFLFLLRSSLIFFIICLMSSSINFVLGRLRLFYIFFEVVFHFLFFLRSSSIFVKVVFLVRSK